MIKQKAGNWLVTTALGALFPLGSALAADLPVKAKPIIAATFDWSGVYIGAHAGYGGGEKDWAGNGNLVESNIIARGALLGGQLGFNKQIGSFVFGAELSGSWADISGAVTYKIGGPVAPVLLTLNDRSRIDGIGTLAGRVGLAADRWLVFAKAGLSAVHEEHSGSTVIVSPVTATLVAGGNEVRYAPMIGFGTEYAPMGNWSVFGEYNYHYLGDRPVSFRGTATQNGAVNASIFNQGIDQAIHVAKVGVNYRWGGVQIDPSYRPVPSAPGNNWSGGYIGVQGGYAWGTKRWPDQGTGSLPSYRTNGWLAGASIGANAQAGSFVFGVEGEIMGTGISGNTTQTTVVVGGPTTSAAFDTKVDWLALATARAGFVVGSSLLLYGKGGVAIAEERHGVALNQTVPATSAVLSAKAIHTGAAIGVGAEYAITPNWSIKAEYDYIRMAPQRVVVSGTGVNIIGAGVVDLAASEAKISQDLQLVKFGVNYHFNPLPVVVAKY